MTNVISLAKGTRYGASPVDWDTLTIAGAGLDEDLLPVVCNPNAVISPESKMKKLGKTPSIYNAEKKVVGLSKWSQRKTTEMDIKRWRSQADYGICIQTRNVRALDVDIPDAILASEIRRFIEDHFEACGAALCIRMRENSSKFLAAFHVDGSGVMPKRFIHTRAGVIEFLGDGQQFVAVGMHESRVHYQWEGGLPFEFPKIRLDEFEALFTGLEVAYGIRKAILLSESKRPTEARTKPNNPDPVSDHLYQHGYVYSESPDGARLNIRCPFEHEHTTESSESATQYFLADTGGFARGHFKCLHAHCAERADGDFLAEIGFQPDHFRDMTGDAENMRYLIPDAKGRIPPTVINMRAALSTPSFSGIELRYDEFEGQAFINYDCNGWQGLQDEDYVEISCRLELRGFKPSPGRQALRDIVDAVVKKNRFDSAQHWLKGLADWDFVNRIETFLPRYFGADDTPYTRAVGWYMWTALAGRVLVPGLKADMVVTFIGSQGVGKTRGVHALVPDPKYAVDLNLRNDETELARQMRGRLVAEFGELRGLASRDAESIKAFITRQYDTWTPKYRENSQQYARRTVFFGTTNSDELFTDETGNRRWLPVVIHRAVDVDAIKKDLGQLWAEARDTFLLCGLLASEAERLGREVTVDFEVGDSWVEVVAEWLATPDPITGQLPEQFGHITTRRVLAEALRMEDHRIKRADEMRMSRVIRKLGFTQRKRTRIGKTLIWACQKPS